MKLSTTKINKLAALFIITAFIGGVWWTESERDRLNTEDLVTSLLPHQERAVRNYAEMTSKLTVGDLVLVTDLDNLGSGRYLAVTEVYWDRISLEGRYDAKESMTIYTGLKSGMEYTGKHTFYPLYQSASNRADFLLVANWFWIQ